MSPWRWPNNPLKHVGDSYLLTYSTEESPSWEANRVSVVKKSSTFYGTRRFITAFTSAHHLSLSWASSIQSLPPHPISWRSIFILSSHLHTGIPSGLFPSGFPTETLYMPLLSSMPRPSHSSQADHLHSILWAVQIIKLLIMYFSIGDNITIKTHLWN